MKYRFKLPIFVTMLALAGASDATVLTFEGTDGPISANGGITFSDGWVSYSDPPSPYNAHSGNARIYTNDELGSWTFDSPVSFDGAWFAGYYSLSYDLFSQGQLVASSGTIELSDVSTFLGNSYTGLIDKVVVNGTTDYYVADDITFNANSGAVPEPASWALLIAGFAMTGVAMRRRKTLLAA